MPDTRDAVAVEPLDVTDWAEGARLLEQAIKAGNQDPNAAYLLAMCYKHLDRIPEARQTLSKIAQPDANVHLQRGVLAFLDRDFAQAVEHFTKSLEQVPTFYPAAYNLMLTRLCLGQQDQCVALIPQTATLAPNADEQRFLKLLGILLTRDKGGPTDAGENPAHMLAALSPQDEARLVDMLAGLGQFDISFPLLAQLVSLRPKSQAALGAYFSAALVQAKQLMDRFKMEEAYSLLAGLQRRLEEAKAPIDNMAGMALVQMLGACSCLLQDFERAGWYFRSAQEIFQRDAQTTGRNPAHVSDKGVFLGAWLEQNLALTYEFQGRLDKAEQHWNRYCDYLENYFSSSRPSDYLPKLAFEGLSRLADVYTRKEKWTSALAFLQRAHRIRPADYDTLERLFHLYTQLKKHDEARRVLRRLREVRPNDPQVELFEMDVREVRGPEDIERLLGDVRRVLQRYPGDMRVEERSGAMLNNVVPMLEKLGEQYTAQINKVIDQMRRLPSYQINWPIVRNVMRDLEEKFFQLRRVAQKCLSLLAAADLRRDVSSLINHCDRKIDQCHSLGE